jgi:hypothetical protein
MGQALERFVDEFHGARHVNVGGLTAIGTVATRERRSAIEAGAVGRRAVLGGDWKSGGRRNDGGRRVDRDRRR